MNRRTFLASLVASTTAALLGVQPRQLGSPLRVFHGTLPFTPPVSAPHGAQFHFERDGDFIVLQAVHVGDGIEWRTIAADVDHVRMGHLWTEEIV